MKLKWRLLIPDWGHLDELWKNPDPFCLWPVGNQPFIAHWMDRAVVENIENVEIYVADRPSAVRDYLNGGAYWSRNVTVIPIRSDEKAPSDAVPVIGLPRENKVHSELENPSDLFQHWLHLNKSWVQKIKEYELRIETPIGNGGWVGPQTRISPSAKLVPPFWIQGKCDVGSNTVIGPNTCIGENTIIDDNAIVRDSIVLPGTMVGRNTQLDQVAADGGLLIDVKRGCRINILDAFILSDLGNRIRKAPLAERLFAILLFTLAAPIVALSKMDWTTIEAHDGKRGGPRSQDRQKRMSARKTMALVKGSIQRTNAPNRNTPSTDRMENRRESGIGAASQRGFTWISITIRSPRLPQCGRPQRMGTRFLSGSW